VRKWTADPAGVSSDNLVEGIINLIVVGHCDEESVLSNTASILDSSAASRLFSAWSCSISLLDVVDGAPVERSQQAPPRRQGGARKSAC
jgi:hypothetical protein